MRTQTWLLLILAVIVIAIPAGAQEELGADEQQENVILLPTVTEMPSADGEPPVLRRPVPADESSLSRWARRLDAVLHEAAQDLGLTLDVSERLDVSPRTLGEDALVQRAAEAWVVSPRLSFQDGKVRVRLVAVAPGSRVLLVRTQELAPREVTIRAMVMLRDIVQAGRRAPSEPDRQPIAPARAPLTAPARSQGRAVFALNAAAFGGYVGYALQRASGSDDDRLTYPLIALGTGIGLGASMIIADEWDVGLGDAWFLSAGAWWPAASGLLLADGYDVEPESDRFMYGVVGASAGLTLATTALTFKGMGEGGATLTHSGGAFGLLFGGIAQAAIEGETEDTPTLGMGYGTGAGVLVAGAVATQMHVTASRVLLIDLAGVLGGLTGAAAASPLVFDEERGETENRAFVAAIGAGTIAGGVIGYLITEPKPGNAGDPGADSYALAPYAGPIANSLGPGGEGVLAYGAGVRGLW